jgi:anti-sigma regulatory factor (Ser/Thr protein kinase)
MAANNRARTNETSPRGAVPARDELRAKLEESLQCRRQTGEIAPFSEAARGVEAPVGDATVWVHEFAFAADTDLIPSARRRIAQAARACGLIDTALLDMVLAVDEALTNAVQHGSPRGEEDEIAVRAGVQGREFVVEVSDHGSGFALCDDPPESLALRGRGIPFMRSLVDQASFACSDAGTVVLLAKLVC